MFNVEEIKGFAKLEGYGFNHYSHPLREPTKIVLLGSIHGSSLNYDFQRKIITYLSPEVVLHEFAGINSSSERICMEQERMYELSNELEFKLKLCDMSETEIVIYQNSVLSQIKKLSYFNDEQNLESIIVDDDSLREMVMGKIIRDEVVKTNKPLEVIVGSEHARPTSRIHEELRCHRAIEFGREPYGYVTINQDARLQQRLEQDSNFFR